MEANGPGELDGLWGRQAVKWLFGRKQGGSFFDGAVVGVTEAFGAEREVSALAPFNVRSEPTDFFFQVEGSVESDEDWACLVTAHKILIEMGPGLRRVPRYENLHLVLEPVLMEPVRVAAVQEAWLR